MRGVARWLLPSVGICLRGRYGSTGLEREEPLAFILHRAAAAIRDALVRRSQIVSHAWRGTMPMTPDHLPRQWPLLTARVTETGRS